MIYVVYALAALAGAGIHLWRHPAQRRPEQAVEVVLLWWIVVTIGLGGIVGGLFHLFDGPHIAREIGFTRGDGGFQTEVGFGDLALGLAAVLCIWIRDRYWLAILLIAAVSLWGDAYGHIHQEVVNDNHDPDNSGPVLYADIVFPLVGLLLYAARERLARRAPGVSGPVELVADLHRRQGEMYAGGSIDPVVELLAGDIVWHVPGRSPIAGDHRGVAEVIEYFKRRRQLANATMRMCPGATMLEGDAVAQFVEGSAELDGKRADLAPAD